MAKEEQQNVEIVKQFYNYFKSRDMPSAFALFADNATLHGPAAAGVLPWGGAHHGKDGAAQFFKALGESLEPQQFELRDFIAQGKKVVSLGYQKGLSKPTGKPFERVRPCVNRPRRSIRRVPRIQ